MSNNWDFYLCLVDDAPASLFVDLGIRSEAPLEGFDALVWLRLYMRRPRPDGLSSHEEFDQLKLIEDSLTAATTALQSPVVYVGRNTCGGCRDFYYYAVDAVLAESCLSGAMIQFRDYEFEIGSRLDPEWSVYRDFLFPRPRDYQVILNRQVIERLREMGDDGTSEREVTHWIYFDTPDVRESFKKDAEKRGFRTNSQWEDSEARRPFALTLSATHRVDEESINRVVLDLFDLATDLNAEYDGWETPALKREAD
jgi:regulator of RNase E activity RraB